MKITIIGSGNVATFLVQKLKNTDVQIVQIISRNLENAKKIAKSIKATYSDSILEINKNIDIVIVAVNDDNVIEVINTLEIKNKLIIYTSGSITLNEIENKNNKIACLWPIYSINAPQLPKDKNIPIVLNYVKKNIPKKLSIISSLLSNNILLVTDHQKQILHLCATIVNNFTNHLYTIANDILNDENLDFKLLYPLIENTTNKLKINTPDKNQTGAAVRNDKKNHAKTSQIAI